MRWPLSPPKREIGEYLDFSVYTNVFWSVLDRWHLCAGDKLALVVIPASSDEAYSLSAYLRLHVSYLSG